jgi:hypothetical protein
MNLSIRLAWKIAADCVSTEEHGPVSHVLAEVFDEGLRLVATDRYAIVVLWCPTNQYVPDPSYDIKPEQSFLLPVVPVLTAMLEHQVTLDFKEVLMVTDRDGSLLQVGYVVGTYPDWRALFTGFAPTQRETTVPMSNKVLRHLPLWIESFPDLTLTWGANPTSPMLVREPKGAFTALFMPTKGGTSGDF